MPTIVNPTFRLDVDGKLFKNKDTNLNIQDTLLFNNLFTRLSIHKGDLPLFPDLGLKQHLGKINFNDEAEAVAIISDLETDMEDQLGRSCKIDYEFDIDNKHIDLSIEIDGMGYPVEFKYSTLNGSIRVIEPQFTNG